MERINPYHTLGWTIGDHVLRWEISLANWPPAGDGGALAAALELYHLAHRDFPAELGDLVPRYLPRIPTGLLTGEPPAYSRIDAAHFRLTSAHWHDGASEPEWIWYMSDPAVGLAR